MAWERPWGNKVQFSQPRCKGPRVKFLLSVQAVSFSFYLEVGMTLKHHTGHQITQIRFFFFCLLLFFSEASIFPLICQHQQALGIGEKVPCGFISQR